MVRRTNETRARLEVHIVRGVWALLTSARPA
jgi:hypothetical protein